MPPKEEAYGLGRRTASITKSVGGPKREFRTKRLYQSVRFIDLRMISIPRPMAMPSFKANITWDFGCVIALREPTILNVMADCHFSPAIPLWRNWFSRRIG